MSVDFKTFLSIVPSILDAKFPVLMRGRHGIGKSTVVYQIADQRGLPVVERRASQMTEGDLLGLPKVEGNVTQWLAPEWLHRACNEPVVLFLDEVDRATLEVRQGIFELCDSRKIAGYSLHEDTIIFACVNGGEHGSQYQVGEMDPAELDRYTVFDVEPTVEDWLAWAKGNILPEVWDFINQNHNHLEHKGDYEPNKVYPSRRSWERLSRTLSQFDEVAFGSVLYHLSSSFIGMEGAVAFNDFVKNYERQVTVENIIDEGRMDLVENFVINEHNALIEKMKAKNIFDGELSETQIQNVANYFARLPSELAMNLWQLVSSGNTAIKNVASLHSTTTDTGKAVKDLLVEILTA